MIEARVRPVWNRKGNNRVEIEIYSSKKSRRWISAGVKLQPWEWDVEIGQAVGRRAKVVNEHLARLVRDIEEAVRFSDSQDAGDVLDRYRRMVASRDTDFLRWLWEKVGESPDRASTRRHKITMVESLERFGKIKRFTDLTPANIYRYDEWLQHDDPWLRNPPAGRKAVSRSRAGLHNYHKSLKPYVAMAYRMQLIESNPYDHFKDEKGDEGKTVSLTRGELAAIMSLDLSGDPYLSKARDLFVFQTFTGLAYVDAMDFTMEKVVRTDDGKSFISGTRVKTGAKYYAPLPEEAAAVLERYGKVPYLDNGTYNARLKLIAARAGITKRLTSHVARHTFITLALEAGAAPNVVQRMAGHTSLAMTERYTHLSNSFVEEGSGVLFQK